jgi:hypothetical protein
MPKRVRVVTANDPAPAPRVVTAQNTPAAQVVQQEVNPRVSQFPKLTPNERRARQVTSTTMGRNLRFATVSQDLSSMSARNFGSRFADTIDSQTAQFYSPQLSTDFLEKPQNLRERRAFYRFFYNSNEIVGQAIDMHSTLPLSKLRLVPPKGKNKHQNEYVHKFFMDMCDDMKLFKTLIEIAHEYTLFGNAFVFAEEHDWREEFSPDEAARRKEESKQRSEFLKQKYGISDKDPMFKGWSKLLILPPDQVRVRKLPMTDDVAIEYLPDPETRKFLTSDIPVDPTDPSKRVKNSIPNELKEKIRQSGVIPLDTDPNTGSHVFHLARKKSQYEPLGVSIIERCINTLVLMDKLRQAQTSIASRHMTPMRVVWADQLNPDDIDNLREQVDMALVDPDFSIIANYEIHWEEMGVQGRLLDIEAENESSLNRLFAGLGVTREILTGEGTYTGSKISLEIMNTQYLLFREIMQDYVENYLFKPIAKKKGFIEYDDYGNEVLLYPKLSFTRLAIRDNEQFFDAAFQLYQKGSVSIDLILDILNIDPDSTKHKIEQDLFTVNDSIFNEVMRNIYTNAAAPLVEKTNLVQKIAEYLKLQMVEEAPAAEGGASRFSSKQASNLPTDFKVKIAKVIKYFTDNPEALNKVFGAKKECQSPSQE